MEECSVRNEVSESGMGWGGWRARPTGYCRGINQGRDRQRAGVTKRAVGGQKNAAPGFVFLWDHLTLILCSLTRTIQQEHCQAMELICSKLSLQCRQQSVCFCLIL